MTLRLLKAVLLAAALALAACAHQVSVEPQPSGSAEPPASERSVAYVISSADLAREAVDQSPGGDSVNYFPYRDLEPGLRQMLGSLYSRVTALREVGEAAQLQREGISLIFVPTLSTQVTRFSPFTWIPTNFEFLITYRVQDPSGREVFYKSALGKGEAFYTEVIGSRDFGLAGRRAAKNALDRMRDQIRDVAELR